MEPKEKKAFEPSGLVPRSIVRTFERFRQQLLPGSETAAIREYRISRYQVLVSARCLFTLLIIPIATNWLVSSWLLSPLVEHFWNTQQNEIFLNSYQEERAFAELESFSEKLFFESLLNTANTINVDFTPVTPYVAQRWSKEGLAQQLGFQTLLVSHYPFAKSSTVAEPSHAYLPLSRILGERGGVPHSATSTRSKKRPDVSLLVKSLPYKPLFSTPPLAKYDKSISSDGVFLLRRSTAAPPPLTYPFGIREMEGDVDASLPLRVLTSSREALGRPIPSGYALEGARVWSFATPRESNTPSGQHSVEDSIPLRVRRFATPTESYGVSNSSCRVLDASCFTLLAQRWKLCLPPSLLTPYEVQGVSTYAAGVSVLAERERGTGVSVLAAKRWDVPRSASMRGRDTGVSVLAKRGRDTGFQRNLSFVTIPCNGACAKPINDNSLKIKEKVQNKILELAVYYNQQTIKSITNIVGDVVSLVTLGCLFIWMKPEITILKSFLIEAIYSLSDTTKSFLLILLTDLLVGFHSPRGWETALELLLKHFGLPENQDFVFLFVATFPVLLDTVFKYWIFRHLNKISPSTVATYHSMIE